MRLTLSRAGLGRSRTLAIALFAMAAIVGCSSASQATEQAVTDKKTAELVRAAFTCSVLAAIAEDVKERDRLVLLGYERGKPFFEAMMAKSKDDEPPLPRAVWTADFVLGMAFEQAGRRAEESVPLIEKEPFRVIGPEERKARAAALLREQNCALLK